MVAVNRFPVSFHWLFAVILVAFFNLTPIPPYIPRHATRLFQRGCNATGQHSMPCKRYELGSLSVETAYRIANLVNDCGISCHVDDDKMAIELEAEQAVIDRLDYSMRKIVEVARASSSPAPCNDLKHATICVDLSFKEWGSLDGILRSAGATRTLPGRGNLTIEAPASKIPELLSLASAFDKGCNVERDSQAKRLLVHLERGHTKRQALLGRLHMTADDFDSLTKKLVASGLIVISREGKTTTYRKAGE